MGLHVYGIDSLWLSGNSDEEDETADLMRELEKIKRERAEQREREVGWKPQLARRSGC